MADCIVLLIAIAIEARMLWVWTEIFGKISSSDLNFLAIDNLCD